jgi:hypothetical protein
VNLVYVRLFPVTDLHEVMAYALTLAKSRNLDVLTRPKRVLRQHFCNFGLLEFRAVLERNSRRGGTGKKDGQSTKPKSAAAKSA